MKLKTIAPLDTGYMPMALVLKDFKERAENEGRQQIVIGIERNKGYISTYEMTVFADGTGHDEENFEVVERVVKSLLWVRGGYKIIIAGSEVIGGKIGRAHV